MTAILGRPRVRLEQVRTWARERIHAAGRTAPGHLDDALNALWSAALKHGIVPEVMITQSAKETAVWTYLRPDGTPSPAVRPGYHNTCGLKPRDGADANQPHAQFATWHQGALAHAQHLYGYLGIVVPDTEIVDPRYVWVGPGTAVFGSVTDVEQLGGRWAPAADYGTGIVRDYLTTMPGW